MAVNTKVKEMLEFSDKNFKAASMKMFQPSITNSLEINEKLDISSKI